jgi:hypothetical protein
MADDLAWDVYIAQEDVLYSQLDLVNTLTPETDVDPRDIDALKRFCNC